MEQNVTFVWTDAYIAVNGSKESKKILTNTILISFGIPICLENFLAIVVLLKSSRLIDQVRILSINLAITDCLSGLLLSIPDDVFGGCLLKKYFTAPFINVSLITVTMFNMDRCFSLKFALRYYEFVTPKLLKIACIGSWVAGLVISYLMFYDPSNTYGIFCGIMHMAPNNSWSMATRIFQLLTILSNLFMYIYMSMILVKRSNAVSFNPQDSKNKAPVQSISLNVSSGNQNSQPCFTKYGRSAKYQIRVVQKLAVITGFFLLCCTPYLLLNAIPNIDYTNKAMRILMAVTAGVMFLNSAINPVLYVWRFTESRYQLKKFLFFWNAEKLKKLENERNSFFASYKINSRDSRQ